MIRTDYFYSRLTRRLMQYVHTFTSIVNCLICCNTQDKRELGLYASTEILQTHCLQAAQQSLRRLQGSGLGDALSSLDVASEDADVRERARSALRLLQRQVGQTTAPAQ